jgi:hypothetical protein
MADNRARGLTRRPDFGVSAEDRLLGAAGASEATRSHGALVARGAPGVQSAPPPVATPHRRPLKVADPLADELRDAVLFLRGKGRPELTQNQLLDEIIGDGLARIREKDNGGNLFPVHSKRTAAQK